MIKDLCFKVYLRLMHPVRNEKGAQAVEYVALVAVVATMLLGLMQTIGKDTTITTMFMGKIKLFMDKFN